MNYIYNLMEMLFTVIDNFFIIYFTTKFLGRKKDIEHYEIISFFFFIILNLLTFSIEILPKYEGIITVIGVGIAILYSLICLDSKRYYRVLLPIIMFIVLGLTNVVIVNIISIVLNVPIHNLVTPGTFERYICGVLSKILLFLFGMFISVKLKKIEINLTSREWKIICLFIVATLLETIGFNLIGEQAKLSDGYKAILIVMDLLIVGISFMLYNLVLKLSEYNKKILEESMIRLQLEERSKNVKEIEKSYKQLKILEHDVKHHYTIINTLLSENRVDEAKEYMEKFIQERVIEENVPFVVNSSMVNAILSSKYTECKEKRIASSSYVIGDIPKDMEMDVSIILANLIDNAIEASEKIENPAIRLEIFKDKNYLNIIVKNKILTSVLNKNPELNTSKVNKKKHGIGKLSIKSTVDRYNGIIDYYEEDNNFIVNVGLKLN